MVVSTTEDSVSEKYGMVDVRNRSKIGVHFSWLEQVVKTDVIQT